MLGKTRTTFKNNKGGKRSFLGTGSRGGGLLPDCSTERPYHVENSHCHTIRPTFPVGIIPLWQVGISHLYSELRSTKGWTLGCIWLFSPSITDGQLNAIISDLSVSLSYHLWIIHFHPDTCPVLLGRPLNWSGLSIPCPFKPLYSALYQPETVIRKLCTSLTSSFRILSIFLFNWDLADLRSFSGMLVFLFPSIPKVAQVLHLPLCHSCFSFFIPEIFLKYRLPPHLIVSLPPPTISAPYSPGILAPATIIGYFGFHITLAVHLNQLVGGMEGKMSF